MPREKAEGERNDRSRFALAAVSWGMATEGMAHIKKMMGAMIPEIRAFSKKTDMRTPKQEDDKQKKRKRTKMIDPSD